MKRVVLTILVLIVINLPNLAQGKNENAWYPDSRIPNIQLVELFTFKGLPNNTDSGREIKILVNGAYAVGYCEALKVPLYAVYRYGNLPDTCEEVKERYFIRPPKFQVDLRTDSRVTTDDYTGLKEEVNGVEIKYDRGHMAPNYGIRTQYGHIAQLETFFMTNIVPQYSKLNRGIWEKAEKRIARELAQDDRSPGAGDDIKEIWVISGPIFEKEIKTIGPKGVARPDAFFKVVVRRATYWDNSAQAIALYYPNSPQPEGKREQFTTVRKIEELTGLDFHPNFEDKNENKLETTRLDWEWNEID